MLLKSHKALQNTAFFTCKMRFFVNFLNDKTITLLNLEKYRVTLADSAYVTPLSVIINIR